MASVASLNAEVLRVTLRFVVFLIGSRTRIIFDAKNLLVCGFLHNPGVFRVHR